ncbi:pyrroline-5-carboxylate reductase dimerization-domain-containing protein [Pelagophyceae sp. CCMP2097]|nr:pyrroline-5-carboxylate reductase dimerization-domain-containing protein [Pelagophyceae sp. CCMP2097]
MLRNAVRRASSRHFSVAPHFAFVGAGKMAEAMIAPILESPELFPQTPTISFFDVSQHVAMRVALKYPTAKRAATLADCVRDASFIVLATKPQNCAEVFGQLSPLIRNAESDANAVTLMDPVLLSILAGVPLHRYLDGMPGLTKVVRSMPNTPAQIRQGVTVWTKNAKADFSESDVQLCRTVLRAMGKEIFVTDESFIDMATSISGSGPAYVFLLVEAMVDAGVQEGFPREIATQLVHQTILGSINYAIESDLHPAVLKDSVTSPAGTTASALYTLEKGGFRTTVQDAIWACYRRSLEMGGHDSNVGPGRSIGRRPSEEFPDLNFSSKK